MQSSTDNTRFFSWSLVAALVLFIALWGLDFPKPMIDDLFYSGASLNLASGGDFSNPLLERQQFPGHLFFYYPPVHPRAMAGWLEVFGISSHALTVFQLLAYLVTAIATISILRRNRAPLWLEWMVPLGVCAAFLKIGLRPEPWSVALTMAGFAMVECIRSGTISLGVGFMLMALGTVTAPRTGVFGAVIMAFAAVKIVHGENLLADKRRFLKLAVSALAGTLMAFLIFLLLIHFKLGEFLKAFSFNTHSITGGGKLFLLKRFFKDMIGVTSWPILLLPPLLLLFVRRKSWNALSVLGLCLICAFPCVALIGGLGHGSIWYAVLALFLLVASLCSSTPPHWRKAFFAVIFFVMLVANSNTLFNVAGIISGKISSKVDGELSAMRSLPSTPDHPLLVDTQTARYVFDYRLPKGSLDWDFAAPFPQDLATDVALRPSDVYLLGPGTIELLQRRTHYQQDIPAWTPFSSKRWSYNQFPRQAFLIHASDCGELRER